MSISCETGTPCRSHMKRPNLLGAIESHHEVQIDTSCPLACNSPIRPSVAITCWRTAEPSRRLSTICSLARPPEIFLRKYMTGSLTPIRPWCAQTLPGILKNHAKSATTWHYIFALAAHRGKPYQCVTAHTCAPTVEEQSNRARIDRLYCFRSCHLFRLLKLI